MQRHPFSITPAFQNKYAISRLAMKTAFLAAVAATVCAEWWMAEEKASGEVRQAHPKGAESARPLRSGTSCEDEAEERLQED